MTRYLKLVVAACCALFIGGCTEMYPGTFEDRAELGPNDAVLLFGVTGPLGVDYLQYCGRLPCKNYRFGPRFDGMVALPIPVSTRAYELNSFGIISRADDAPNPPGYKSHGLYSVESAPITIEKRGIYFHMTLDTARDLVFTEPDPELLRKVRARYGALLSDLEPVNFEWPEVRSAFNAP